MDATAEAAAKAAADAQAAAEAAADAKPPPKSTGKAKLKPPPKATGKPKIQGNEGAATPQPQFANSRPMWISMTVRGVAVPRSVHSTVATFMPMLNVALTSGAKFPIKARLGGLCEGSLGPQIE